MGKKVKGWTPPIDAVEVAEATPTSSSWTPPADAIEVSQKKTPEQPSIQSPEASGDDFTKFSTKPIAPQDATKDNSFDQSQVTSEQLKNAKPADQGFLGSIGRTIQSGLLDQLPKEYYAQRLRSSKGNLEDAFDPRSDVNQFGDKLEKLGLSRDDFAKWNFNQADKSKPMQERVKQYLTEKGGPDAYDKLNKKFQEQNTEERVGFEKQIQEQNKDSEIRLAGVTQNLKDIDSPQKLLGFLGNSMGQALYRVPTSLLTGTTGSIVSESSAIYDRQLDLLSEKLSKEEGRHVSREEVIKRNLDKPAAYQSLAILAGGMDAVSAGGVLGMFRRAASKELTNSLLKQASKEFVKGGVFEGLTEGAQGEIEEKAASGGAGTEYAPDAWRIATSFSGGFFGGGPLSTVSHIIENGNKKGTATTQASGEPLQRNEEQPTQQGSETSVQQSAKETGQNLSNPGLEENSKLQSNGKPTTSENRRNEINPVSRGTEQEGTGIKQEDAESITRGVQDASPETQGAQTSPRQLKKEQDQQLEAYAKKSRAFIEDVKKDFGEKLDGGTEQDVHLNKEGDKVIKVNGLANHTSWSEFWDRLNLQNKLFPDAAYKLIGFTKVGGRLSAVSEQPYVKGTPVPRQELIQDLAKRGFFQIHPEKSLGENQFYNPELGVRLTDVHGENVIKDEDGNIRYIDPMLDRENPFVDEGSKQHFNNQKTKYSNLESQSTEANKEGVIQNQPTNGEVNEKGRQEGQQNVLTTQEKAVNKEQPSSIHDIARQYHEESRNPTHITEKEKAIAQALSGSKVHMKSVKRFGDKNSIGQSIAKSYIRKKGMGLDQIAMSANEYLGSDSIEPGDVWEFMKRFPNGAQTPFTPSGNPKLAELANKYSGLTGKYINRKTAKSVMNKFERTAVESNEQRNEFEKRLSGYYDSDTGEFNYKNAIEHFEQAPNLIKSAYGLTEQEFQNLKKKLYDEQEKNNAQKSIARGEEGSQQNSGNDFGNESGQGQQSIRSQEELARSIQGKIRSLRSAESPQEQQRIAQEIYEDTGQYILNREGVIVGSDASFADKTSDTFFDLIDEGKSVYLLDPDSKIAQTEKDYQEIQDYINFVKGTDTKLPLQDGKLMFDDAFANHVINAAKELGFDGVRLLEIDGTNSTIQITNFNKLTHVAGEDFVKSKKTDNGTVSNESQRPAPTAEPTQNSPPEVVPPQPPSEGTTNQNSEGGENLSGIKKALAPEEVVDNTPVDERTDEQVLAQGKQDVESGKVNPRALVDSIRKQGRALQPNEVAALVYYKAQLDNDVREATQAFVESKDNQEQNLLDKTRLDGLNMDLNDYYEMSVITARQQSMAFRLRKMLLDSEYNLQSQISKYKANNNGEISPDVQKRFEELDQKLKEANDRITKLEGEQKQREEEYYFQRIREAEKESRKRLLTAEKKKKIDKFFDSLLVETNNKTVNASLIPGITLLPHVWNGAVNTIRFSIKEGLDVVEAIQEAIDYIKKNTKEPFDEKKFRDGMEPLVQKIVPKPTPERKVTVNEKGLSIPDKLIKELVANGAETIDELTQQIQDLIKADHPNVTIREIRDAITKYGKTASLSQDEIDTQVRHLKRMGRMLSQLEDIEKKQRPLRSGLQRDKLSDEERRLQKQVREGLKDLPIDSQEEEQAWKTALDKVKSRLTNQIADLEDQITKGEKTPKKKGIEYDEEALALQAKRDELRQILEDIEGKPELSDEQKIRMAVKSTERSIEEYERRIKEKDFSRQKSTTPQTQELIELKAKRDAVKEQYKQLKDEEGVTAKERLEARKKTVAKAIEEYERRIKEGDFSKKKVNAVTPDTELQKIKSERERIKYEFDVAQEKNRLKNRNWAEKVADYTMDIISIPKSLESSIDLSAALRQGGYLLPSYPKQWGQAFTEMFRQAASKQKYEQWIMDLKSSDIWPIVQQSKLFIADNNAKLSAQEEQFASKLVRHVPLLGESFKLFGHQIPGIDLIGASNRAYAGFLNKLRLGVFAHGMDELKKNGFSIEKNEAEYKALADFVNNATGRGKLLKVGHFDVEAAAPVLNALFFSPRFMASRFNLLNPNYYRKMPPSVRKMALKSTGSYALFAVAIGLMAMGAGADWDKDPRSNDFLKIKVGDRRWSFLAGLNDYIRFMAILLSGQKVNNAGESYEMNRLEHLGRFTRSKLSPVAGSAVNLSLGADMVGQPATPASEAQKLVTPLYIQEIAQTANKGDIGNLITTAVPSIFGIGVQDYDSSGLSDIGIDGDQRKVLIAAGAHINRPQFDQVYSIKGVKRKLTTDEYERYVEVSNQLIKDEIAKNIDSMEGQSNDIIIKQIGYIVKTAREQARYQLFESEEAEFPDTPKEALEIRQ